MTQTDVRVPYSYLPLQLNSQGPIGQNILEEWKQELDRGYFTLGPAVERLEKAWAETCGMRHAIGVNSGTDALLIALTALGIDRDHDVITTPNTFVATVGAIVANGAHPVFCDVGPDYLIDMEQLQERITPATAAIIPVDLTGRPAVHGWRKIPGHISIVRDACQSIGALYNGISPAAISHATAYSLHPLKNIHACGDGGMIVTDDDDLADWIRLYRNHGLKDRDTVVMPGINSRLDTLQAIAAWHLLQDLEWITAQRNHNAAIYRDGLAAIEQVTLPPLDPPGSQVRQAYHTFMIQVERRAELMAFLADYGIETKIHYPVPIHLQPGYAFLGYKQGDFPMAEAQAARILSLPIHEYLNEEQLGYVIDYIQAFYRK